MRLTQQDYEARAARLADGTGSDEDRRLVKLYERQGVQQSPARPVDAPSPSAKPTRRRGSRSL